MERKQCRRCEAMLPLRSFSLNKGARDGLMGICKRCDVERKHDALKQCRSCLRDLPRNQFHARGDTKDGLQSICRQCKGGENQKRRKSYVPPMEGFIPLAQQFCLMRRPQ